MSRATKVEARSGALDQTSAASPASSRLRRSGDFVADSYGRITYLYKRLQLFGIIEPAGGLALM
jgi:hypothetical protein